MASAIPTFKAGWLLRQSSVLKRWKRSWFVLYGDGNLAYYDDDKLRERQGNFSVSLSCSGLKTALECEVNPPEDRNYGGLLKLVSRQNDHLVICAFDSDEALGWRMTIEPFIRQHTQQQPQSMTVQRYPAYPRTTTTVRRYNSYPNVNQTNYTVQQNVPVYFYPNHGPVQVQYHANGQPYYLHPQTQVITVIRENDPYYYRSGNLMWGLAAGAVLGAAMWSPFLFF